MTVRFDFLRLLPLPALAATCLLAAPAARAQMESRDAIALQNQILELRQEVQQLQQNQGGSGGSLPAPVPQGGADAGSAATGGLTAQLLDRVSRLEDQVRELRGRVDDLTNQVQTQTATLSKQVSDLGFQLQQGGGNAAAAGAAAGAAVAPAVAGPAVKTPAAPPAPRAATPEQALRDGNAALARHDYAAAEQSARAAGSSVSAQFLLGQALTGERQYQQAALAYYDAYQRAPRGPRAPDALLGVGYAMTALGDHNSACEALGKLRSEFPAASAKVKGAASALRARSACH